MKKKLMLFLLALLPLVASSAPVQIKGIYYNLNTETGEAEVTNSMGGSDQAPKSYSGSVDIPSSVNFGGIEYSVTSIGDRAFSTCVDLTSVTIPNSVTSIGDYAFNYCTHLPSIIIPSSVTSIGELAFFECYDLESIYIPRSVTSIGQYAFSECGLSSVSISSTLTSIENGLFELCQKLTSVTIPSSVTSIGKRAFLNCSGLTSVTIGCRVESIGSRAFSGCSNLTTITSMIINPLEIGDDVFQSKTYSSATLCVPIGTKGKYEATAAWNKFQNIEEMGVEIDGIYYLLNPETKEAEVTNRLAGDYNGEGSYSGSVVIPPTVIYNGEEYTVRIIGGYAFYGSPDLTSVTMPESVTTLKIDAFAGCTGLTSITIPNSVTKIDLFVFSACSGLTSVTIGDNVETIGSYAFAGCSGLTSVTIPNSVKIMENAVFYQCTGLTSVTLGSGLTSIGELVFLSCSNLTSVTSLITDPFEINENVFYTDATSFTSATLYVPKGTKEKYEATPAWNLFQKIEEIEVTEKKGDVNGDGAVDVADIAAVIDIMAANARRKAKTQR